MRQPIYMHVWLLVSILFFKTPFGRVWRRRRCSLKVQIPGNFKNGHPMRHKQTIVAKLFNNEASSFENLSILTEARHTKFGKSSNVSRARLARATWSKQLAIKSVLCVCPVPIGSIGTFGKKVIFAWNIIRCLPFDYWIFHWPFACQLLLASPGEPRALTRDSAKFHLYSFWKELFFIAFS